MPCNKDFFGRAKSERQKEKANKGDIFSFICQENIIKCFGPGKMVYWAPLKARWKLCLSLLSLAYFLAIILLDIFNLTS